MFKNLIVYRIQDTWQPDLAALEAALSTHPFVPCPPSQDRSAGWVPPRGADHGAWVESVGGQWLARFAVESKAVPASAIQRKVDELRAQIEATTGRLPGRKESKALRDDALLALLPMAFARESRTWVWLDPTARWLFVDAASQGRADEITTALVESLPGFGLQLVQTTHSPQAAMADWLIAQEAPEPLMIERECELKSAEDPPASVRFSRHRLDIEEVRQHIAEGKRPTRLALSWQGRVGFVLTDTLQLKKIAFLDGVYDGRSEGASDSEDDFDANVAIATGEWGQLWPELVQALGGEVPAGGVPMRTPAPVLAPAGHGDGPPF